MRALLIIVCGLLAVPAWAQKPIIGVAGGGYESRSVRYAMASIWEAGGYPILLDTRAPERVRQHVGALNGVIIAGNSLDINPKDYGARQVHPKTVNEETHASNAWDAKRDDYEYALIALVTQKHIPFLGICSGAQRLNVAGGGSLAQHINGQMVVSEAQLPHQPIMPLAMVEGSRVARIVASRSFADNSLHHQHIEQVREGFRVAARDVTSGITEAIEPSPNSHYASHPFLIGVQWHPEYGATRESQRLIAALVQAAKDHAHTHPVSESEALAIDASLPPLRPLVRLGVKGMRAQLGYSQPAWVRQ